MGRVKTGTERHNKKEIRRGNRGINDHNIARQGASNADAKSYYETKYGVILTDLHFDFIVELTRRARRAYMRTLQKDMK